MRGWRIMRGRAIAVGLVRPYPVDPSECFTYAWQEDARSVFRQFSQRFPCSRHPYVKWREFMLNEHTRCAKTIVADAEAVLRGRLRVLGFDVQTDVPPRWFRNYVQGGEWHALSAERLDYRRADQAGGVRYCWELNRHGYFLTLAQALRHLLIEGAGGELGGGCGHRGIRF